ncbi:MAG: MoaD/ThiS family protein [Deltaproteobacteria bacterium]|nr:MAG: MoaD/ThiS family protein [Deltaproteobacteria bacterium]
MPLQIQLYGTLREIAGTSRLALDLPRSPADVEDLKTLIGQALPELEPFMGAVAICVDDALVGPADPLPPLTEIALIPPVSGG